MRRILLTALAVSALLATAQGNLKTTGRATHELAPDGWTIAETRGDLNKDGLADLVILATPDSTVTSTQDPVLGIYWGNPNGTFTLFQQYEEILFSNPNEYTFVENSITITNKGVLRIEITVFSSAGSSGNYCDTYLFRYQKGDFFLIGQENYSHSRYTGKTEKLSFNYLTHKKSITTGNVMKDHSADKVRWEKIPREPLKRLGSFAM